MKVDRSAFIGGVNRVLLASLLLLPASVFGQDYLEQFPHRLQTKQFDFYCKGNETEVSKIAGFADSFIGIVNGDFFAAKFNYPIRALVFENHERFGEFLRKELHVQDPPGYGIYMGQLGLFVTHEDSGLGTFTHEILHPLVEENLRYRPAWAMEGIPTFFEKFFGYWDGDQMVAYWGYQNPWRIELLGDDLKKLDLKKILYTRD